MQPLHTLYQYFVNLQSKSAMEVCKKKIIPFLLLTPHTVPPPPVFGDFFFLFFFFLLFSIIFAFKIFVAFEAKYSGFGVPVNEFSGRARAENKKSVLTKLATPPLHQNQMVFPCYEYFL